MVSKLLTFITGRLNPWIIEFTHGLKQLIKQARRPEFYKYIDLLYSYHCYHTLTNLFEWKYDTIYAGILYRNMPK